MARNPKKNRPPQYRALRSQKKEAGGVDRRAATGKIHGRNRFAAPAVCAFLLLAVVLVYGQTIRHEFINYDDNFYVYENDALKDGVTWKAVAWSFTTFDCANWHPVTWLSHMLDCQMFGLRPGWHHAVNVALHIINSILLYILLLRMTASQWRSAMVAVLFALHPLHVESVAWIAERKDVLSTMFALLTILAYLHYISRPSIIRYVPVFVLLALGLMSKPMLVTLPFVLLLLDYWPLGRWVQSPTGCIQFPAEKSSGRTALWLVIEKLPLMLLAAASSAVTYIAQQEAMQTKLDLSIRVANALVSYVSYLGKTLWPYPLVVFYPYKMELPWWQPAAAVFFLIVVSGLAICFWRRRPYLLVGWLWYLGTLLPVIGLVQVGIQSMADRYTYIPLIGIFIIGVWGVADLSTPWRNRRIILGSLAAVVTLACMIVTFRQVAYWTDNQSIFEYTLSIAPDSEPVLNNLGVTLVQAGRPQEAIEHFQHALRINPVYVQAQYNLSQALDKTGRSLEAIELYKQVLCLKPNYIDAHYNLGNVLLRLGRPQEAIEHYEEALRINPDYIKAHNNLGAVLVQIGRPQEAIEHYEAALRIKPDNPESYNNLGVALVQADRPQEAIEHYEKALRLKPDYPEAHCNMGIALVKLDRPREAIDYYRQALRLKLDFAEAYYHLALAYAAMHQSSDALAAARKALELARSQNHTALAKKIENWLNSYQADLPVQSGASPFPEPASSPSY